MVMPKVNRVCVKTAKKKRQGMDRFRQNTNKKTPKVPIDKRTATQTTKKNILRQKRQMLSNIKFPFA